MKLANPRINARSGERSLTARTRVGLLRALVGDLSFAIVSNNCWGAHIYQALDLPYLTPFIGLFVPPDSYLRLVRKFDALIAMDLAFVSESTSGRINDWRRRSGLAYPIGVLGGDVEVHFQHYKDVVEAETKWRQRLNRMPSDPTRRFFKFDDREGADATHIMEFCDLPLNNKVCFTARAYASPTVVIQPPSKTANDVVDGLELGLISKKYFNTLRWLSTRPAWLTLPSII